MLKGYLGIVASIEKCKNSVNIPDISQIKRLELRDIKMLKPSSLGTDNI